MDPEQDNPARPQRGFDSFIDAVIGNNDVGRCLFSFNYIAKRMLSESGGFNALCSGGIDRRRYSCY